MSARIAELEFKKMDMEWKNKLKELALASYNNKLDEMFPTIVQNKEKTQKHKE